MALCQLRRLFETVRRMDDDIRCCDCGREFLYKGGDDEGMEHTIFRTFLEQRWRFLVSKDDRSKGEFKLICSECADKRYAALYKKTGNAAYKKRAASTDIPWSRTTLEEEFSKENIRKMKKNAEKMGAFE